MQESANCQPPTTNWQLDDGQRVICMLDSILNISMINPLPDGVILPAILNLPPKDLRHPIRLIVRNQQPSSPLHKVL